MKINNMKIKENYSIEIVDMGTEGDGIGRADGVAVFIPGAVIGDTVLTEITQVKKNFARGKITEIEKPSPWRIDPACAYAGECGGCPLAAMSYEGQLQLKKKWVTDKLKRIGGIEEPPVEDVIGMTEIDGSDTAPPIRYRNKAQFPVRAGRLLKNWEGKYRNEFTCSVGFYRPRTHDVVHCETCLIQAEPAEAIAAAVKRYVDENTVSVYDEKSGMGLLRHVIVRSAFATGEVMAILVVNGDHLPKIEKLVEVMDAAVNTIPYPEDEEQFWSLESVVLNVNKAKGSEIMGKECITVAGKSVITDYLGDLQFELSPHSFYQVNPVQMKKLYDKVLEFAQLTGEETVLDLYCGVGTIGLYCAEHARRIIGVESVKPAVLDANRNAVINGIVNAEYIYGKAEEILPKRLSGIKADVVILDPPRSGCERSLLESILEIAPDRIVYVSCDPATLARDVKILGEGSGKCAYRVERVQPVDMFPGSGHVETVTLLVQIP